MDTAEKPDKGSQEHNPDAVNDAGAGKDSNVGTEAENVNTFADNGRGKTATTAPQATSWESTEARKFFGSLKVADGAWIEDTFVALDR